jgi:hypothetical protein
MRATIHPDFWVGYMQLAQAYEQLALNELAFDALRAAWRFSGGNSKVLALRGFLLGKLGRATEADEVLNTLEAIPEERYIPPYSVALVHAGLGHSDAAFLWLDRAYQSRDVHLAFLPVDPKWDPYRSDARFASVLDRCAFHSPGD